MGTFKEFCQETAVVINKESVARDATIEDDRLDKFIANMKNSYSENVTLSYIQKTVNVNPGDIVDKVSAKYSDGDIPNGLINKIAIGLFGKPYADLVDADCKIINVLSLYYTISN